MKESPGGANYDCICCCEGLEHLGNPLLFLKSAIDTLAPGGFLLITTPNTWNPAAKMKYLLRGFFPGFPCLVGKISEGTHMHIMPWSYPHLYLYLQLSGFESVELHETAEEKPKRVYERIIGFPQAMYCRAKARHAKGDDDLFWRNAGGKQSLYGRRLIVTAKKPI